MYNSIFLVFMCDLKSIFEIGGQTRLVDTNLGAKFAIINRTNNENKHTFTSHDYRFSVKRP